MSSSAKATFNRVHSFSSLTLLTCGLIALALFNIDSFANTSWQVPVAILALAIGIPHGAVDHLIAIKDFQRSKMIIFVLLYVFAAILSAFFIFKWNVLGFQLIVLLSALHFGFGDAAYLSEVDSLNGQTGAKTYVKVLYALTAGLVPVFIPLLKGSSGAALNSVNNKLVNWSGSFSNLLQSFIFILFTTTFIFLLVNRRFRDLADISILALVALVAPPLIAFAFYFGAWHAIRHTARLTTVLNKSLVKTIIPGLPALVGAALVATAILIFNKSPNGTGYLWNLLVVVWALTVPHMLTTSTIDRKAFFKS